MNILYLPVVAIVFFAMGFGLISIPTIRNALKKKDIFFPEKEMEELTNYRNSTFASENESYNKRPVHLD